MQSDATPAETGQPAPPAAPEAPEEPTITVSGEEIEKHLAYLKSTKSWAELEIPEEMRVTLQARTFRAPSKIQSSVLGFFQRKIPGDLLAQAQNGSGKTLAFAVPAVLTALEIKASTQPSPAFALNPCVVVLSDTKELCYQTLKVLGLILPAELHAAVCLKELGAVDGNSDILLTTVGSLAHFDTLKRINWTRVALLVLDECDKIFAQDFSRNKLSLLLKRLAEVSPALRVCYFSATCPQSCLDLIFGLKRKVTLIALEDKAQLRLDNLMHYYLRCSRKEKFEFVNNFFQKFSARFLSGSVIVFVNSRQFASNLAQRLVAQGHKCEILTSDMSPEDRLQVMEDFKAGKLKILVTTNLLARGIDNRKVSLVVNYDLPYEQDDPARPLARRFDVETYLHRVGRTARFGDQGIALNIVEREEEAAELEKITAQYGIQFTPVTLENFGEVLDRNRQAAVYNAQKREYLEEDI